MRNLDSTMAELDAFLQGTPFFNDYLKHRARYRHDVELVLDHMDGGPLLEIGSVPCFATTLLKLSGIHVRGIDLAPWRSRALIEGFGLDVTACDIEREPLPSADAAFDLVLFAETLEHLRVDPLFTLSEINRVLTPNGTLLLTTPNLYSAQNIVRFLLGRGITDAYSEFSKLRHIGHMGHAREYSHKELRRILLASGFKIESLQYKHYYYPRTLRGTIARFTFLILPQRFRSYQVIVAKKIAESPALRPLIADWIGSSCCNLCHESVTQDSISIPYEISRTNE